MARGPTLAGVAVLAALIAGGGYVANQVLAHRHLTARVAALTGGDPERGRAALQRRPCGGCHEIPGVAGAEGKVGPPLTHFAGRAYVAGRVSNTPDHLIQWIEDPHAIDPQSAMPPMGVGEPEARDMAAYLYTLP
jgi:cytochrome c2